MRKHLWMVGLAGALLATAAMGQDRPQPAPPGGDDPEWLAQDMAGGRGSGHEGSIVHRRIERRVMRGGPMGHGMMMEKLDLTAAQRAKMAEIHDRQERKAIQTRADLRIGMLDLHKLIRAEKPDERAIDAQIDRLADLRASLGKARVAAMLEMRASLTPDQQKKLREMHGPGMGRGMGMGGDEGDDWESGPDED